jgi:hypothetical protein
MFLINTVFNAAKTIPGIQFLYSSTSVDNTTVKYIPHKFLRFI